MEENNITTAFSGSIPAHYDQYLGPLYFEPYALDISGRIDASTVMQALEIACGTGRVTRHLRRVLHPEANLIASDISDDMLAIAREKLIKEKIEWKIIDAQELPFKENSLDLVVCCFGYMFVPDKQKAFEEAHRVLKPGGNFLFNTWDRLELNGSSHVYRQIVKQFLGDELPPASKLPFSMYDQEEIKTLLQNAGFGKIKTESVYKEGICATADEAAEGMVGGGLLHNEIMKRNPGWLPQIKETTRKEISEKFGSAPMITPMQAVVCSAWK